MSAPRQRNTQSQGRVGPVAELVQKQDVITVPAHQQRLRAAARRGPGLDKGIEELLRVGPQDQHGRRPLVRVKDRGRHVQLHLVADLGSGRNRRRPRRCEEIACATNCFALASSTVRRGSSEKQDSAVPAGNDHILVAVRLANQLHILLDFGPQGGIARGRQPSANGGAETGPRAVYAGIAQPLASPGDDLAWPSARRWFSTRSVSRFGRLAFRGGRASTRRPPTPGRPRRTGRSGTISTRGCVFRRSSSCSLPSRPAPL